MSIIKQYSRNCEILKTSTWQPQWSCDHHLTCVVDLGQSVRYHVAFVHFNHYFTVVIDVKIWIEIAAWVVWVNGIACQRSTRRLTDMLVVNGALITSRYWMLLKSSQITMAIDISIQYLLSSLQFHWLKINFKINISTNSRQQNLLEKLRVAQLVNTFPTFHYCEDSLLSSWKTTTWPLYIFYNFYIVCLPWRAI